MLELKNIKKDYPVGDGVVQALKGVSMQFRKNEFVSVLGPSGCGKTTMLNIIGGLDSYTDGDLVINGVSTKEYKDRDWDAYRNHSIGFVFQSYNLIPHQTVLQNVELALSLSGVGKHERRQRAKEALKRVGLETQYNKKPGEMSGGQMQRVAIARAIVNNPDIILADEPTGALDTETSIQVMEILKEISKDRLVIMVTHNPELAEKYSTRIIRMLDGEIKGDTMPVEDAPTYENTANDKKAKKEKKPSLSFGTSFALSLKNLFTKKGRTALTSFAGSIGIIGIALILAVSQGTTSYINTVQEETLSSYPIVLEAQHIDMGTLLQTFLGTAESVSKHENDAIYQKKMMYDMMNALNNMEASENDLAAFKKYIEAELAKGDENSRVNSAVNGIQYSYPLDLLIYTKNTDGEIILSDTDTLLSGFMIEFFGADMSKMMDLSRSDGPMSMGGMASSMSLWQQMLPGDNGALVNDLIQKQYDCIYGNWPTAYNEVVLVVDSHNELDDFTLYALGLKSKEDLNAIADAAIKGTQINIPDQKWSYEEICAREYKTVFNSDCYTYDSQTGAYIDLRETEAGLRYLYNNGTSLKVSGIIRPKENAVSPMLTGAIGYTHLLTEYVIENAKNSEAMKAQIADPNTDIFTNLPFKPEEGDMTNAQKATEFKKHVATLDEAGKASAYIRIKSIPSKEMIDATLSQTLDSMTREDINKALITALKTQMGMSEADIEKYVSSMSDEDINEMFCQMMTEQIKMQMANKVKQELSQIPPQQLATMLDGEISSYNEEQLAQYHDEILEFSKSTYEKNLEILCCIDLEKPSAISLYASSFADKDVIEEIIADYNEKVDDLSKIRYTDYVGLIMSSVTTIIDAITYVLIAFVAVSLIVSSIMIGVITLISVQERTKEIGILRAIGASKKNVSAMFNAETMIIGFTSGLLGVCVTYLLCIPINIILHNVTGIQNLSAQLPITAAVILVIISVLLTLVSGIIPSRSAAKKDPVVALRSE